MKKIVSVLCLFFVIAYIYANDTYFYMASGQLVPTQEIDIEVEMQEEIINIVLEPQYYEITVDFFFYNYGNTVDLEIGFPFFCVGLGGNGEITDFKCWTNDVETSYVDYPIVKKWANDTQLENAYVRNISFPSKKITKTRITYKSTYGREAPSYSIVKYLYGTGSSWKNSIGKMIVRIQNNDIYSYPQEINLPDSTTLTRINDNTWEGIYTNIEPNKYTDSITIEMGNIFGNNGPRILKKDRYFCCIRKISSDNLFWFTKVQLRLIRNAIYAFNGYPFKSPDLIELFEKSYAEWGWFGRDDNRNGVYQLDENFSEDKLSEIEKHNVRVILKEENKLKKLE